MTDPLSFAVAAERLVGCHFRLHGRAPETGLDCVGLLVAALRACGHPCELPTGYRIRTGAWPDAQSWAARNGFVPASSGNSPGDVLLVRPGPGQLHFLVISSNPANVVEAHAGLGRVVCRRLSEGAAVAGHWRLSPSV